MMSYWSDVAARATREGRKYVLTIMTEDEINMAIGREVFGLRLGEGAPLCHGGITVDVTIGRRDGTSQWRCEQCGARGSWAWETSDAAQAQAQARSWEHTRMAPDYYHTPGLTLAILERVTRPPEEGGWPRARLELLDAALFGCLYPEKGKEPHFRNGDRQTITQKVAWIMARPERMASAIIEALEKEESNAIAQRESQEAQRKIAERQAQRRRIQ
jgi:hypothetical protein